MEMNDEGVDPESVEELADALDMEDPEEKKKSIASFSGVISSPTDPPFFGRFVDFNLKLIYYKFIPDKTVTNKISKQLKARISPFQRGAGGIY